MNKKNLKNIKNKYYKLLDAIIKYQNEEKERTKEQDENFETVLYILGNIIDEEEEKL